MAGRSDRASRAAGFWPALIASRKWGKRPAKLSANKGRNMVEPLRLGIAGLGTVGAAVVGLLNAQAADLASRTGRAIVASGSPARYASTELRRRLRSRSSHLVRRSRGAPRRSPIDIDLFVELIGGDEGPARHAVEAALARRQNPS